MYHGNAYTAINSSLPGQNADDIFICIFMNENVCILIQIAVKFVPQGLDN